MNTIPRIHERANRRTMVSESYDTNGIEDTIT